MYFCVAVFTSCYVRNYVLLVFFCVLLHTFFTDYIICKCELCSVSKVCIDNEYFMMNKKYFVYLYIPMFGRLPVITVKNQVIIF